MSQHSVYIGSISAGLKKHDQCCLNGRRGEVKPFKPEITIVIFVHHKPRIAVAILDL